MRHDGRVRNDPRYRVFDFHHVADPGTRGDDAVRAGPEKGVLGVLNAPEFGVHVVAGEHALVDHRGHLLVFLSPVGGRLGVGRRLRRGNDERFAFFADEPVALGRRA